MDLSSKVVWGSLRESSHVARKFLQLSRRSDLLEIKQNIETSNQATMARFIALRSRQELMSLRQSLL